jgi:hypothetical protein
VVRHTEEGREGKTAAKKEIYRLGSEKSVGLKNIGTCPFSI